VIAMIWTSIFWTLSVFSLLAALMSVVRNPRWYWAAAAASWVVSFLGAFSIGLYLFVFTLIFLALAIGHSAGRIKRWWHAFAAVTVGVAVWALLVRTVDDAILFYPIHALFDLFFTGNGTSGSGSGTAPGMPVQPTRP
jgi:hypothetical protein